MARCDQCHIDGGIRVGRTKTRFPYPAKFEFRIEGAKVNLCKAHMEKASKDCEKRGIEINYIELEGDENE